MSHAAAAGAESPPLPNQSSLDRLLYVTIAAAFLLLCLAPTRFFLIPFADQGDYVMYTPPNIMDLLLLGLGLAVFARARSSSGSLAVGLGVMILVGAIGLALNGEREIYQLADLLLFNVRLAAGLALGAMLSRSGLDADFVALMFLGSAVVIAAGAIPIALGFVSYDFYSGIGRFGSLGLGPNETGIVLAGAFNMMVWLTRERTWPALAAPLLSLGVVLTGSRMAALLTLLGLLVWIPGLVRLARDPNRRANLSVTTIALALSAWIVVVFLEQMVTQGTLAALGQRAAETGADESSTFRVRIYLDTIAYLIDNPLVLLAGVGGSNVAVEWVLSRVLPLGTYHTHDLALQLLTAYGVLGLVAGMVMLRPLIRRSARFPDDASRALRAFALTLVAGQVVQYGLWQVKFLLLFTMALGYVTAASDARVLRDSGPVSLESGT